MPHPSRRSLLLAAAALPVLAACKDSVRPTPEPTDPDTLARAAAAATEQDLVDEYDVVMPLLPAQAERLSALRKHHRLHLNALIHPSPTTATATATATASPGTNPAPTDLVRALVAAERAAQRQHAIALGAVSPDLALLLASLAASAAANAAELSRK